MKDILNLYDLIMDTARKDERIRAVTMEGSYSCTSDVHDKYSDITFFVSDIREFTADKKYISVIDLMGGINHNIFCIYTY